MKSMKYALLAVAAMASLPSLATELNVEYADLNKNEINVELNDVVLPIVKGLDADVEFTRGDSTEMVAGIDYAVDTTNEVGVKTFDLEVGAEFQSKNKDILLEADTSKVYGNFKPYVELDYTLADVGDNNGDYLLGVEYSVNKDFMVGASYNGEFAGKDVDEVEFTATYALDDRLSGEVTHTMERNSSTESTEIVGTYAFNDSLYTAATYTFEEAKDDTFGVEVGYKF